jgi:hypothetical protein
MQALSGFCDLKVGDELQALIVGFDKRADESGYDTADPVTTDCIAFKCSGKDGFISTPHSKAIDMLEALGVDTKKDTDKKYRLILYPAENFVEEKWMKERRPLPDDIEIDIFMVARVIDQDEGPLVGGEPIGKLVHVDQDGPGTVKKSDVPLPHQDKNDEELQPEEEGDDEGDDDDEEDVLDKPPPPPPVLKPKGRLDKMIGATPYVARPSNIADTSSPAKSQVSGIKNKNVPTAGTDDTKKKKKKKRSAHWEHQMSQFSLNKIREAADMLENAEIRVASAEEELQSAKEEVEKAKVQVARAKEESKKEIDNMVM